MSLIDRYSDTELEKQLLAVLLQQGPDAIPYFEKLRPAHFKDEGLQRVFIYVKQLLLNIGSVPSAETLRIELLQKFPKAQEAANTILATFTSIQSLSISTPLTFLMDKVVGFSRARDMLSSMEQSSRLLEEGKVEDALKNYQDNALALQATDPTLTVIRGEMTEDFPNRVKLYEDKKLHPEKYIGVPTGIDELDKLTGGLWKGEFGFVFGKSGVGKSFCLLAFAYAAFMRGLKVLVIPVEMPYHQWAYRYDSRVTHIEYSKFKWADLSEKQFQQWQERHEQLKKLYYDKGGRLYIEHVPLGCTMGSIRVALERHISLSEPIDILILDYADLVIPPEHGFSEQAELTSIFRTLKGFAQLYNIPVWTATQAKRESYQKAVLDLTDVGFASGKGHISDLVVGITRTDEDILRGIMKLHVSKYRDGTHNTPIVLHPNLSLAAIDTAGIT